MANKVIIHYGVKGMKWGVRKSRQTTIGSIPNKKNEDNDDKYDLFETRINPKTMTPEILKKVTKQNNRYFSKEQLETFSPRQRAYIMQIGSAGYPVEDARESTTPKNHVTFYSDGMGNSVSLNKTTKEVIQYNHNNQEHSVIAKKLDPLLEQIYDEEEAYRAKHSDTSDFLEHYGVKGMKWGVHKTPEETVEKSTYNGLEGYLLSAGIFLAISTASYIAQNAGNRKARKLNENEKLKVTSLKDVKRIQPPENMKQSLKNSNNTKSTNKYYKNNCPNTTMAYELRRRGYDVLAKPATKGESSKGIKDCYKIKDLDIFKLNNTSPIPSSIKKNNEQLKKYFNDVPDNYRGAIIVNWQGLFASGHIFNVEKTEGKTIFIDAQSGKFGEFKGLQSLSNALSSTAQALRIPVKTNPADYLNKAELIEIFRVDNIEINDNELESRIMKKR